MGEYRLSAINNSEESIKNRQLKLRLLVSMKRLTFDCAVLMVSLRLTLSCEYLRQLKPVVEILMRLFFYRLYSVQ
jgi:hypothetical protein